MWQCDFACKRKWTIRGMVDLYFLVFIHLESRRIWVSPCTANPTGEWTTQQARNFDMFLQDENCCARSYSVTGMQNTCKHLTTCSRARAAP